MNNSLLHIVLVEFRLRLVLEQILIKILHDAVLDSFTVEHVFNLDLVLGSPGILRRKQLIELLSHVCHQLLNLHTLFFSRAVRLYDFG
jgi:hypothetical protein